VIEFWESHSRVNLDGKHVVQYHIAKGKYAEHDKHILEMIEVTLFKEF